MSKVSAVIINFNGFDYVKDLIPTIKKQSYGVDEIIVIDDCSTDDSFEKLKKELPGVIVKQTEKNSGPGVARDLGRKIAKNKKILFLDNDTELPKDTVKKLVEASKDYPEYTFFVARVLYFAKKDIIQKDGTEIHYLGITINSRNHGKSKKEISNEVRELKSFPGVCYLIDLENAQSEIQNHDASFFYTFEDLDFAIRNYLRGNKALLVPKSEVFHKDGTAGLSYRNGYEYPTKKLFYFLRNRWFFIFKIYSFKSIILLIPINLLVELSFFFFSLFRSKDKLVYFKSHISLLSNLRKVFKKREFAVNVNVLATNEDLRLNKPTLGGRTMASGFHYINSLLLFYGKYILSLQPNTTIPLKAKKKIGFVVRGLTQGGVRRFIVNILTEIDNLNPSDFEFHMVHDEPEFDGKFENIQSHYIKTKNKILFDYLTSFNLLRKLKFDVLIYPKNVIPVPHFLLRGKKINIIHDLGYFESSMEAYPFWDTLFMKAFMKMSCKFSDKTFAVSNATKKDIIKRFGINEEKVVVINEGVEENFKIIKEKKRLDSTLKKYKLDEKLLFYAGSVSPRKNLMRVLEAFNKVKDEIPHSLVITGNKAWGKDKLEDYVEENLQGKVKRLGFVSEDELVDLYNLADGYVFPSLYEGFGLPILEAQKCGCPVLTSNVTSCPEVAGEGAIIVDPYSVNDIADGILILTTDKKKREKLVKKGFENVKRYSWFKAVNKILESIEEYE